MAKDMGQIAKNTLAGKFLVTSYITPASYSAFPVLEDHPDYIRYPGVILTYAALFYLFGSDPSVIRVFNICLILPIFFFSFLLINSINPTKYNRSKSLNSTRAEWNLKIVLFAVILSQEIARIIFKDAYEVYALAIFLGVLYFSFVKRSPIIVGVLMGMLYLVRPNMLVFFPAVLLFLSPTIDYQRPLLFLRSRRVWLAIFIFGLINAPFVLRNLEKAGTPIFSLQQTIELKKNIIASHEELYRSFRPSPKLDLEDPGILAAASDKFIRNFTSVLYKNFSGLNFLLLVSAIFAAVRSRKILHFLIPYLICTLLHLLVFSFYLEAFRLYIPIVYPIYLFGVYEIIFRIRYIFISKLPRLKLNLIYTKRKHFDLFFQILFWGFFLYAVNSKAKIRVPLGDKLDPPPREFRQSLLDKNIKYVYSNNPFSLIFDTDLVVIYSPIDLGEISELGPKEAQYYVHDGRYSSEIPAQIRATANLDFEIEKFSLWKLNFQ
jgi:hypothetical protein